MLACSGCIMLGPALSFILSLISIKLLSVAS